MPLMPGMVMTNYPAGITVALFYRALLATAIVLALLFVFIRPWLKKMFSVEAADTESDRSGLRSYLAYWLGALWLLDAVLQMQPQMVTRFIGGFLAPILQGQPTWVHAVIDSGIRVWSLSPIWFNVAAVFIQLLIGLGLLFSRDGAPARRTVLYGSIGWGFLIWTCGEAFGSLFNGGGPLVGSPGSVLLYVAGAVLLLLPARVWSDTRFWRQLAYGMAGFFLLMAFLAAWPPNGWWAPSASASIHAMAEMPQPGMLARPLSLFAQSYHRHPVQWNSAIMLSSLALAIGWIVRPGRGVAWAAIVWTVFMWYLGQDFGVLGGMGTDPNTGGILLGFLTLWGRFIGVFGPAPSPRQAGELVHHAP